MPNRFVYVKRGYDPEKVDQAFDTMEEVIQSYKEKDASIKNAILNAQIAADNIVLNAKNQAAEIKQTAVDQLNEIKDSISLQRNMLTQFQSEYNQLMEKYFTKVNDGNLQAVFEKLDQLDRQLSRLCSVAVTPKPEKKLPPAMDGNQSEHKGKAHQ